MDRHLNNRFPVLRPGPGARRARRLRDPGRRRRRGESRRAAPPLRHRDLDRYARCSTGEQDLTAQRLAAQDPDLEPDRSPSARIRISPAGRPAHAVTACTCGAKQVRKPRGELKAGWFVFPQLEAAPPGVRGHGGDLDTNPVQSTGQESCADETPPSPDPRVFQARALPATDFATVLGTLGHSGTPGLAERGVWVTIVQGGSRPPGGATNRMAGGFRQSLLGGR